ncbi:MAG: hypothetical protein Q9162_002949 [Coniocarpon cinnabarinum]
MARDWTVWRSIICGWWPSQFLEMPQDDAGRYHQSPFRFPCRPSIVGTRHRIHLSFVSLRLLPNVRLRGPWVNWKRVGLWSFYSATSYAGIYYLLGRFAEKLDLDDDNSAHQAAETQDEEDVEDEDADTVVLNLDDEDGGSFVPVQAPKQLPRQNYKQSDPEWQEFIKLSQDSSRQATVRHDLAEKLVKSVSAMKPLQQRLGKDIKWTKSWLDFTYPDKAAPEYIQRG